jgi:hypothetical protein
MLRLLLSLIFKGEIRIHADKMVVTFPDGRKEIFKEVKITLHKDQLK